MIAQLGSLAYVDRLTGLPNRNALHAELARLGVFHDCGFKVWLCWIDLVGFGEINRTRGYREGDRALRRFGARGLELAPNGLNVFRWGGDEFVGVALSDFMPRAVIELWAERLSWCAALRWDLCEWDGGAVDVAPRWSAAGSEDGCGEKEGSGILNRKVPSLASNRMV